MRQELLYHQNCNRRHEDLMVPLASRGGNFCEVDTWLPRCVIVTTLQWLEWVHYELNTIQRENQNHSINMHSSANIKEQVVKMIHGGGGGDLVKGFFFPGGGGWNNLNCKEKEQTPWRKMWAKEILPIRNHKIATQLIQSLVFQVELTNQSGRHNSYISYLHHLSDILRKHAHLGS